MSKRLFDIVFSLLALIITLPIILAVAGLLLFLSEERRVLLRQPVLGKGMRIFRLLRFCVGSDVISSYKPVFVELPSDLPFWQRCLLVSRVNCLPQLLNLLKGDISLFGPKLELPEFLNYYESQERKIFDVRPGLFRPSIRFFDPFSGGTNGGVNVNNWREYYLNKVLPGKKKLDMDYIREQSFWNDVKLIGIGLRNRLVLFLRRAILREKASNSMFIPLDVFLVALSYFTAFNLRFDWNLPASEFRNFVFSVPYLIAVRLSIFVYFGFYRNIWKYFGIKDLVAIIKATTTSSIIYTALLYFSGARFFSRSVLMMDLFLVVLFIGGVRLVFRLLSERSFSEEAVKKNVLIYGAGDVGAMLCKELATSAQSKYNIVGFIDDDPAKRNLSIHGVKVLGDRNDLSFLVQALRIDEVFIAISKIASQEMKSIVRCCKEANVRHRIVPAVADLLNGRVHLSQVRNVEISDLFGREPVKLNFQAIKQTFVNRTILITGAGGSIGSELSRQLIQYHPKKIILVDKNANYLHEIEMELRTIYPRAANLVFSLTNITNYIKMKKLFETYLPDVVFHAAAQKHVPIGEVEPEETLWNNVYGTKIAADLAICNGAEYFVLISTDKAVNPTSVMGASKRIAELYVQNLARKAKTKFATVRFGNVLNSNSSVVPLFMKQIERGGPVTITHPDIERYFMSISEAVQLVLQAVSMVKKSEIFILEMGKSIKIKELAEELIKLSGLRPYKDIEIKYIGLRPGEKLFEELVGANEEIIPTEHQYIKTIRLADGERLTSINSQIVELMSLVSEFDRNALLRKIKEIVPEFHQTAHNYNFEMAVEYSSAKPRFPA